MQAICIGEDAGGFAAEAAGVVALLLEHQGNVVDAFRAGVDGEGEGAAGLVDRLLIAAIDDALNLGVLQRRAGDGQAVAGEGHGAGKLRVQTDAQESIIIYDAIFKRADFNLFFAVENRVGHHPETFLGKLDGQTEFAFLIDFCLKDVEIACGEIGNNGNDPQSGGAAAGHGELAGVGFLGRGGSEEDLADLAGSVSGASGNLQELPGGHDGFQGVGVSLGGLAAIDLIVHMEVPAVAHGLSGDAAVACAAVGAGVLQLEEAAGILVGLPLSGGVIIALIAPFAGLVGGMADAVVLAGILSDLIDIVVLLGIMILHGGDFHAHIAAG